MADIFLSYAREDLERARAVADALKAAGWSVFWDRRIPPGRSFEDYIEEKIDECRVVVVLWSLNSVASRWVKIEAAHGRDRNPPALIPILIAPTTIPFGFRDLQAADLCAWQAGDRGVEFEELLSSIDILAARRTIASQRLESAQVTAEKSSAGPPIPVAERGVLEPYFSDALSHELLIPGNPGMRLVKIPAGSFLMGSDKTKRHFNAKDDEFWPGGVQGSVRLSEFYIGEYEVTVAQFKACVDAKGCTPQNPRAVEERSEHPVVYVSWHDALQYCGWLERMTRESAQCPAEFKRLLADGWRVSLPSEAEWEKAARGTDGRTHPWGEHIEPDRANYDHKIGSGSGRQLSTTPVGSFPRGASPYGILDMSGNVYEWTRSLYKPYPYVPSDGREDLVASGARVARGGSFNMGGGGMRAAGRDRYEPDHGFVILGFRVVVSRF